MSPDAHGNIRGRRLVVFGCGYVGAAVAREAVQRGATVTTLTRNAAKAIALRAEGMEVVVADLATTDWHRQIPGAADFVLNSVSSGGGGLEGYRQSYVAGMESMLAWAHARGAAGTVVYTSSTSVYPQAVGAVVAESSATGGDERARLLLLTEALLRENGGACRRWFVLRLAGIYGPARHHLLNQVRTGTVAGYGQHRLNLAHRDDIAAAVWRCFLAPPDVANEIFNVADDAPTPKAEVARWLADRIGVPPPSFSGEPAEGRRAVTPDRVIANGKLKSVLGWQPRFATFRAGYDNLLSR
jgi:nucleoside-diphosphate-sugar epimerase